MTSFEGNVIPASPKRGCCAEAGISDKQKIPVFAGMTNSLMLVFLFLAVRILYLFFLNPYYFAQFHYEELYRGMIGVEWLQGRNFPFLDYRPDDYSGAWIFVGAFLSKIFKVLEPSVFALKTWAITSAALTLFFWHQTLKLVFNQRVAFYFSLLFIFASPSFMIYSLTSMGDHTETILFTSIAAYLIAKIELKPEKSLMQCALLGLVLGLGIWFNLGVVLTLISVLLFWLCCRLKMLFSKPICVMAMFLFVGVLPAFLIHQKIPVVEGIHGQSLSDLFGFNYLLQVFTDYHAFVGYSILNALRAPIWGISSFYKWITVFSYALLFFLPMALAFWVREKKSGVRFYGFLFLFVMVYLGAFQLSGFREIRFWMPLMPFLFIGASLAIDRLMSKYVAQALEIRTYFLGTVFLMFFLTNLPLLSAKHAGTAFKTKGYHYSFLDSSVCKDPQNCLQRYPLLEQTLSQEDLYTFSTALALQLSTEQPVEEIRESVAKYSELLPRSFKPYYFYFWGRELMNQLEGLQLALEQAHLFGKEARVWVEQGILDAAGSVGPYDLLSYSGEVSSDAYGRYWRSVGESLAGEWKRPLDFEGLEKEIQSILDRFSNKAHPHLLQGIGRFLYQYWSLRPLEPFYESRQIEKLPESFYDDVFLGIGMAWAEREFLWRIASFAWYWREFASPLQKRNQEKILHGRAFVSGALGAWNKN